MAEKDASLLKKLKTLKDSQDDVEGVSKWCLEKAINKAAKIIGLWIRAFREAEKPEVRVALIYLSNDIIQRAKRKKIRDYVEGWRDALSAAMPLARGQETLVNKIKRVLTIWRERHVYDEAFVTSLVALLDSRNVDKEQKSYGFRMTDFSDACTKVIAGEKRLVESRKAYEDEKLNSKNIESIRYLFKGMKPGDRRISDFHNGIAALRSLVAAERAQAAEIAELIPIAEDMRKFYDKERADVKVVSSAYHNFGDRVANMLPLLKEKEEVLLDDSPVPSPDENAPSPVGSDDDFPLPPIDEPSSVNSKFAPLATSSFFGSSKVVETNPLKSRPAVSFFGSSPVNIDTNVSKIPMPVERRTHDDEMPSMNNMDVTKIPVPSPKTNKEPTSIAEPGKILPSSTSASFFSQARDLLQHFSLDTDSRKPQASAIPEDSDERSKKRSRSGSRRSHSKEKDSSRKKHSHRSKHRKKRSHSRRDSRSPSLEDDPRYPSPPEVPEKEEVIDNKKGSGGEVIVNGVTVTIPDNIFSLPLNPPPAFSKGLLPGLASMSESPFLSPFQGNSSNAFSIPALFTMPQPPVSSADFTSSSEASFTTQENGSGIKWVPAQVSAANRSFSPSTSEPDIEVIGSTAKRFGISWDEQTPWKNLESMNWQDNTREDDDEICEIVAEKRLSPVSRGQKRIRVPLLATPETPGHKPVPFGLNSQSSMPDFSAEQNSPTWQRQDVRYNNSRPWRGGSRMVLLTLEVEGGLVVFAGSILQAKVIVDQPQTDEKELEITLTGQGETGWTEQESSYDAASKKHVTRSRHYKQVEEYLTVQKTLWSKATGSSLSSRQSFDFSINLPPDLPPSFKGTYGSISYSIAAKLKRPMLKFDKEARETLIIVPLCSMAHLRELMEPVKLQKDKQLEVLFWKKGHIHATVNLPRRVHVLGETIPITAEIHNQSSVVVKKTDAKLIQTVTFHCSGRKKEETSNVVRIKRGNVLPGTIFQWNNVSMVIPKSIPPSDFGPRCRLFQAQHKFQFTVVPTGLHFSLDLVTDVKLGSVWQHPPVVVPGQQVPVTPLGNQFPAMHFPVSPQGVPQGPFVGMPYMSPQPGPFPVQPGVQYSPVPPQMPGYPFPPAGPGMAPPYAMPDAPNFVASAPPSDGNLYPSVNFEAPPTYNQACGTSDANNFRPSPDDDELTKDFEKIKM